MNEFESNLTMRERQVTKFDAKEDILKVQYNLNINKCSDPYIKLEFQMLQNLEILNSYNSGWRYGINWKCIDSIVEEVKGKKKGKKKSFIKKKKIFVEIEFFFFFLLFFFSVSLLLLLLVCVFYFFFFVFQFLEFCLICWNILVKLSYYYFLKNKIGYVSI